MLTELQNVMAQALANQDFERALNENATGKRTKSNQNKTRQYLRILYDLDPKLPRFRVLMAFWEMATPEDQPLLALLYALGKDFLLAESLKMVLNCPIGQSLVRARFEEKIEALHPERYSANTTHSASKNLASSWKQAGYLQGIYKNERIAVNPSYRVVAFAMLMAYLGGLRGQFILESSTVKALCLPDSRLRELAFEAGKRDLMRFQSSGASTVITFDHLLNNIDLHEAIQN